MGDFEIEDDKLIVPFNPTSTDLSKSGKTYVLATSHGFQWVDDGKGGKVGVSYNIIRRK